MPVLTERRGRVLLIRLDSEAKLNAMDHAMTLDRPDPGMERVAKANG